MHNVYNKSLGKILKHARENYILFLIHTCVENMQQKQQHKGYTTISRDLREEGLKWYLVGAERSFQFHL
jgi:hypothetical protein